MHILPHEPRFGRRVRVTLLQAATKLLVVDASVAFSGCVHLLDGIYGLRVKAGASSRPEQGIMFRILTYFSKHALTQLIDVRLQACPDTAD